MKKNRGFTLIELLVVMAIIAVLAALSMGGLIAARRAAKDTQRKTDLAQYKSALEAFSTSTRGAYPYGTDCGGTSCNGNSNELTGLFDGTNSPIIGTGKYIDTIIQDPSNTPPTGTNLNYAYVGDDTAGSCYMLSAKMEGGNFWVVCSKGYTGTSGTAACPSGYTCP